ncbi:formate/nitrite transporter family protein, partial [bacterium]|nr:formate/nitrite transporter family protein [bacterium]
MAETLSAPQSYDPTLSPKEYAKVVSALGIKKANTKWWQLLVLGILAGIYIGIGGHLYLVAMQQGLGRITAGAVFGVGLVLVVIAGAELFTGNIIMLVGTVTRLFSIRKLLRNWGIVYIGNFIGALVLAWLVWGSGLFGAPGTLNDLGTLSVKTAEAKLSMPFMQAFIRGILCNMLVILAIIMATIAKDVISKIVCCILPIMAFVACGFEHCVANMYLIPAGLFCKGVALSDQWIMFKNIVPVTLGNIVG